MFESGYAGSPNIISHARHEISDRLCIEASKIDNQEGDHDMDTPKFSNPSRRYGSTYETGPAARTVALIGTILFLFVIVVAIRS